MKYLILSDTVNFMKISNVNKIFDINDKNILCAAAINSRNLSNLNLLYINCKDICDLKGFDLKDIVICITKNGKSVIINQYNTHEEKSHIISTDIINIEGFDINNINATTIAAIYNIINTINSYYDMYLDCYIDLEEPKVIQTILSLCEFIENDGKNQFVKGAYTYHIIK